MKHKSSIVSANTLNEELDLEEEKNKRAKFSGSIDQPQQGIEVSDMENKVSDALSLEDSAGKDPMDGLTDCAVRRSVEANVNAPARLRLPKICTAIGWKEPSYVFSEQGPPHNKLFSCKVTVHVEGIVNTIVECFGDPKCRKKDAQEHAAQGALWCLERYGHVK